VRKLGIPCVLDRFVQQAVLQFCRSAGTDILEHSHVSDRGAVQGKQCTRRSSTSPKVPLGGGSRLEKFFDRVNHDRC